MKRRTFLSSVGAGLGASLLAGRSSAVERPNILWLVSEDTSPDLACYGNALVQTPNLDQLATSGTRYHAAYATCPVCSPARSAMMTGMYQTSIGAHNHRSHRDDGYTLPAPVDVLTKFFHDAGYFTTISNGTNWERGGKTDWNFKQPEFIRDGVDWRQRKEGQPFFAQYNFTLTHRSFKRDPERPIDPDGVELPPYYPDTALLRRDWADYLESLQVLDNQVGALLQRLEEDGLADNTIIVYHGDHGRPHVRGKQWLYEGGIRVPFIVKKPGGPAGEVSKNLVSLIDLAPTMMEWAGIQVPDHLQGQSIETAEPREFLVCARDRCDETVDRIRCVRSKRFKYIRNFYPDRPYMQFNAYKSAQYPGMPTLEQWKAEGKLTEAQQAFMAEHRPEEELYDLKADPHELINLATNIEYKQLLELMRGQLDTWIAETNDQGAIPEPAAVTDHWLEEAQLRYKKTVEARGLTVESTPAEHVVWWEKELLG